MGQADSLSLVFFALSDATRRSILSRLAAATLSVTELAAPYDISLPAITKHLKILERAGLISRSREAQWRPCPLEARKQLRRSIECAQPRQQLGKNLRIRRSGSGCG